MQRQRGKAEVVKKWKVVCLGDSNTSYPDPAFLPESQWVTLLGNRTELTVVNKGTPGKTSSTMLNNFQADVIAMQPDYCIIEEGANDALNWVTGDITMSNIDQMVQLCKANNIKPIIMNCNPQQYSAAYVDARPSLAGKNRNWEDANYLPLTRSLEQAYCTANNIPLIDIYEPALNGDGTQNTSMYMSENASISGAAETHVHFNTAGHLMVFNKLKTLFGLG